MRVSCPCGCLVRYSFLEVATKCTSLVHVFVVRYLKYVWPHTGCIWISPHLLDHPFRNAISSSSSDLSNRLTRIVLPWPADSMTVKHWQVRLEVYCCNLNVAAWCHCRGIYHHISQLCTPANNRQSITNIELTVWKKTVTGKIFTFKRGISTCLFVLFMMFCFCFFFSFRKMTELTDFSNHIYDQISSVKRMWDLSVAGGAQSRLYLESGVTFLIVLI